MSDTPVSQSHATSEFTAVPSEAPESAGPTLDLKELLDLAIDSEASDIHFGAESRIALRIFGEIRFVDAAGTLSVAEAERLITSLLKGQTERDQLAKERELDFSYKHIDGTTFRCNAFYRRGRISIVMRRIAKSMPSMAELGLPAAVQRFTQAKQGLILVCGPTGSGKSTTLCSMLEEINEHRVEHVVTIEDPIEYIFTDKQCVFSQRELHYDTHSFEAALRAAMRQDPDIVMIGELRDRETITAALNLCETGHLVLSTLHTSSAAQTISRLSQAFPLEQRPAVLGRIADSIVGVVSQRLVPKTNGGRVGVFEIMVGTPAIRNAIRQGDIPQMENTISTSAETGMITMRKSAQRLIAQGDIEHSAAAHFMEEQ
jgi:twitching motility protein PilT